MPSSESKTPSHPPDVGDRVRPSALAEAVGLVVGAFSVPPTKRATLSNENRFGVLSTFAAAETAQLISLRDLVVRYVSDPYPVRPLSWAVFGPPGSGKSIAVKQICAEANQQLSENVRLPLTVVNMTQVPSAGDVGRALARLAGEQDEATVPVVFFDEFDAPRNGALFGWLAWFLAPMQDGELLHEGAMVRLKRSVYVFAGGTAATMAEFASNESLEAFRFAKGPDFVSRLRGFLNVEGPNSAPRELRRALILRKALEDRIARARTESGAVACVPDPSVLDSLLRVGRYRHGARSITAVVELCDLKPGQPTFGWGDLPDDHLLQLHVDRGPLDTRRIGGAVAFSGYPSRKGVDEIAVCWVEVARALWDEGATLSYAGGWDEGLGGRLASLLATELKRKSVEPSRDEKRRNNPAPWFESFLQDSPRALAKVDAIISPDERNRIGLRILSQDHFSDEERLLFEKKPALGRIVERFRRRLALSETSVARFAIGGVVMKHRGRVPGVVEEVMLTLALGRPVYVAGGFGGASVDVGILLGLGHPRTGDIPRSLRGELVSDSELLTVARKFQPPPFNELPVTAEKIGAFLQESAFGGPRWPKNGLTRDENIRLFESHDSTEIARLVTAGLKRVFTRVE